MLFQDISYLKLWPPHCLVERNHLCNFVEGIVRKSSVNYFDLDQWFRRCPFHEISYLELWRPSGAVERNHLCSFGRGIMGNIQVQLFSIWSGSGDVIERKFFTDHNSST